MEESSIAYSKLTGGHINIQEKANAGNATQNIHPPLMQKTRIHIQPHTLHHSYIY